ncbi:MAG: 5-formyltetrahydrofolate cyclo-ligase [Natronomonas sp.]
MDKEHIRERIWDELEECGQARFPFPPHGRIPNFADATTAADRLCATPAWENAETVKANPDAPQLPVRRAALRAGKTLFVAVPRLSEPKPFLRLDPDSIDAIDDATTVSGISEFGDAVAPESMEPIDLIVSGSVAVTPDGQRIGKGEGYSDLEFAMLREFGLVDDETTTATTVHEIQVIDPETMPKASPHDVPIDIVCTPERTTETDAGDKPTGIDWPALPTAKIDEIPILRRLRTE